jgi:hypothetical protein
LMMKCGLCPNTGKCCSLNNITSVPLKLGQIKN